MLQAFAAIELVFVVDRAICRLSFLRRMLLSNDADSGNKRKEYDKYNDFRLLHFSFSIIA